MPSDHDNRQELAKPAICDQVPASFAQFEMKVTAAAVHADIDELINVLVQFTVLHICSRICGRSYGRRLPAVPVPN